MACAETENEGYEAHQDESMLNHRFDMQENVQESQPLFALQEGLSEDSLIGWFFYLRSYVLIYSQTY